MKFALIVLGKTKAAHLITGEQEYLKRLQKFGAPEIITLPETKRLGQMTPQQVAEKEGHQILGKLQPSDFLVLLDERGKQFKSTELAQWLEGVVMASEKRIVFVIGGPYGFSEAVYKRAQQQLSLSKLTFSHQMVRMIFLEQLYRAFAIIHNLPYHHE
jgi:23S rRNA (pseudouridine1915-N3)-methyltransferase